MLSPGKILNAFLSPLVILFMNNNGSHQPNTQVRYSHLMSNFIHHMRKCQFRSHCSTCYCVSRSGSPFRFYCSTCHSMSRTTRRRSNWELIDHRTVFCATDRSSDYYGLGVRLGIYLGWINAWIANVSVPEEISSSRHQLNVLVCRYHRASSMYYYRTRE